MTASKRQSSDCPSCGTHDPILLRLAEFCALCKPMPETPTERLMFVPLPAPNQTWPPELEGKP